jgi:hypothetical protein
MMRMLGTGRWGWVPIVAVLITFGAVVDAASCRDQALTAGDDRIVLSQHVRSWHVCPQISFGGDLNLIGALTDNTRASQAPG